MSFLLSKKLGTNFAPRFKIEATVFKILISQSMFPILNTRSSIFRISYVLLIFSFCGWNSDLHENLHFDDFLNCY